MSDNVLKIRRRKNFRDHKEKLYDRRRSTV
jgi:hypothetical protein